MVIGFYKAIKTNNRQLDINAKLGGKYYPTPTGYYLAFNTVIAIQHPKIFLSSYYPDRQ